jgi:aryl-alcohol dehydrogenase-like predicted oxidoreductase
MTLFSEGKIKHIGLSNVTSNTLRRAYKIAPVAAVQTEYSPFVLDIESAADTDLLATCRELSVAVVCYAPLGRGLLTTTFGSGEYGTDKNDGRPAALSRFMEANRAANMKLVNKFKELADKKGCTTAQLSLAWLLKQGEDIIPNPGTKSIKYLEDNWGSLAVQLSDEEELEIRKFVEGVEVAGGRAPPGVTLLIDTKEES